MGRHAITYVRIGVSSTRSSRTRCCFLLSVERLVVEQAQLLGNDRHGERRPGIEPMPQVAYLLAQPLHNVPGAIITVEIDHVFVDKCQQQPLAGYKGV